MYDEERISKKPMSVQSLEHFNDVFKRFKSDEMKDEVVDLKKVFKAEISEKHGIHRGELKSGAGGLLTSRKN